MFFRIIILITIKKLANIVISFHSILRSHLLCILKYQNIIHVSLVVLICFYVDHNIKYKNDNKSKICDRLKYKIHSCENMLHTLVLVTLVIRSNVFLCKCVSKTFLNLYLIFIVSEYPTNFEYQPKFNLKFYCIGTF